jgi:cell division protein FtsX
VVEVYMALNATPQQIDSVRATVSKTPGVVSFTFLNEDDAYVEFKRIFAATPELYKNIGPSDLPTSFQLHLARTVDDAPLVSSFERRRGVDKVLNDSRADAGRIPPLPSSTDLSATLKAEIFMMPGATQAETDAVQAELRRDTRVADVQFLDQAAASADFQRVFPSEPELGPNVSPADLPTSFRLTLVRALPAGALEATYSTLPGVQIVEAAHPPSSAC